MIPLGGLDALFLYAETESMHLHVALTAILAPDPDAAPLNVDRLRELVADRLHLVAPFTRRLAAAPLGMTRPYWLPAEVVDLERHVRAVTVPEPGEPEDLGRVVGAIASLPLDRAHPLWELWLLDGLHDGNVALVAKIHHACIDGVSGAELMGVFFDLTPDGPGPTSPGPTGPDRPEAPTREPLPGGGEIMGEAVSQRQQALGDLAPLLRRTAQGVADIRRRRAGQAEAGGTPLTAPRLSFNRRLTPERNCAFAQIPLADARAVKDATRSTLNDVVLAVCAGALRSFLANRGELPDVPLVVSCPVSTRNDDERGEQNNRVSLLMTRLHTEIVDPLERLHAIRRATTAGKAEHELLGASVLADWSEAADPLVFQWAVRLSLRSGMIEHLPPLHNLTISNVPGPPLEVFLAGARLVRAYPMGPVVEGAGLNITVMSYGDSIDVGLLVCDDALPDVWDLADAVAPAFDELAAASLPRTAPTPGART